ncbi:oxalate decarboxylase [Irpex rosettiformis]|uniref:Oxalate decarboxylase n=1 Tax=Irpex rosettiformis TaxID=378272 RepID=A0ACB8U7U2_9APHY|nr:oxalate decarboxylase [Irpex rosettiformis]
MFRSITSLALLAAVPCVRGAPAASSGAAVQPSSSSLQTPSSSVASVEPPGATVAPASDDPNGILWTENDNITPEPMRGSLGSNILGPQNKPMDLQNADLLAPPSTDSGTVGNAKWPFSLSHNRLQTGGWARQQNVDVLPMATEMAAVNMRLEAGAIRELHWHKTAEWAFILKGSVQISVVNPDGQNFLSTVNTSDLWYFPAGVPHSLQATADDPDGSEFLLVFDSGDFSEDSTFLLTDWLAHVPKEVIAKNFQTQISAFNNIPGNELYIFPGSETLSNIHVVFMSGTEHWLIAPPADNAVAPVSPQGTASLPYSFAFSKMPATPLSGGSVKIVDSSMFKISTTIAAAEVTVEPGGMRELHWHPTQDEWSYFIEGTGRATLFASSASARTFDFVPGDVGYIPASFGHFVENTGNTTLRFLEIFRSDKFQDVSLQQWLALTPPALVKAHLQIDDETIAHMNKTKQTVIGPASN